MWLEGSSTSSDLISEVGSIKDSEIMELYFVDNSDTVGDGTVQVVDVLVLQGPVGVTSAILVMEQALTMNTIFPVPQCASVNVRASAASGHHCQCAASWSECKCSHTNACSGHCFTSRNSSTNHNAGPAFPLVASVPVLFPGVMPPVAGAPWLNQSRPYPSAYMASPAWPVYMPSCLPQPQAQQSSMQAEYKELAMQRQELEARGLEVERRTRALNLNAVRDAENRSAATSVRISRTHIHLRNRHPLNQSMLVPKSHLKDPCPLNRASTRGSRSPVQSPLRL